VLEFLECICVGLKENTLLTALLVGHFDTNDSVSPARFNELYPALDEGSLLL
jgi:hypothetical protein